MAIDSPDVAGPELSPSRAALGRAIGAAKGQKNLAAQIGTTQQQVSFWLNESKKGVPAEFCGRIESATGVPKHELRPDVFPPPESAAEPLTNSADVATG